MKKLLTFLLLSIALCSFLPDQKPTGSGVKWVQNATFFYNLADSSLYVNMGAVLGWARLDMRHDPIYARMKQGNDTVVKAIFKTDTLKLTGFLLRTDSIGMKGWVSGFHLEHKLDSIRNLAYTKHVTDSLLSLKVDKVPGKALSDNNLTDADSLALLNLPGNLALKLDTTKATVAMRAAWTNKVTSITAGNGVLITGTTTVPIASSDTTFNLKKTTAASMYQPKATVLTNIQDTLNLHEHIANKTTSVTTDGTSDIKYPSAKAVKTYADGKVADAITDGITTVAPSENAVFDALATKIDTSTRGHANGVASLDRNGKIPLVQMNDALLGSVRYQSVWSPTTNTPTIPAATSDNKGYYYVASDSAYYNGTMFRNKDWIISNGSIWQKVDNNNLIASVFGRVGNVIANSGDYNTSQVTENTNLYFTALRARASVSGGSGILYDSGSGAFSIDTTVIAKKSTMAAMYQPKGSYAPASGSGNYIHNQINTYQSANFAISGTGVIAADLLLGNGTNKTNNVKFTYENLPPWFVTGRSDGYFLIGRNGIRDNDLYITPGGEFGIAHLAGSGPTLAYNDLNGVLHRFTTFGIPPTGNPGGSWAHLVGVKTDGVAEVGNHIDFHESSNDSLDYSSRISSISKVLTTANTFSADKFISTVANGTAPLTVSSSTQVNNLNAQYALNPYKYPDYAGDNRYFRLAWFGDASDDAGYKALFSTSTLTWQPQSGILNARIFKSTVPSGTPPFTVTSTDVVTNLNADLLDGNHASAFSPLFGNGYYINNQYNSAQSANSWITGASKSSQVIIDGDNSSLLFTSAASQDAFLSVEPGTRTLIWRNGNYADPNYSAETFKTGHILGVTEITSPEFTSTIATGTAPFHITSTTVNSNLNADMVDGRHFNYTELSTMPYYFWAPNADGTVAKVFPTSTFALSSGSSSYIWNQNSATQTADFKIGGTATASAFTDGFINYSTAQINRTGGYVEMQFNGSSGNGVRMFGNTGYPISFTDGKIVSTVGTGTAPFTVASTTQVSNLNSNYLGGYDYTKFAGYTAGVSDIFAIGGQNLYTLFSSSVYPANAPNPGSPWVQGIQFPLANNDGYRQVLASCDGDLFWSGSGNYSWYGWYPLWTGRNLPHPNSGWGNTNYVTKYTNTWGGIGNSLIYDNGSSVAINTTNAAGYTFYLNGIAKFNSYINTGSHYIEGENSFINWTSAASGDAFLRVLPGTRTLAWSNGNFSDPNWSAETFQTGHIWGITDMTTPSITLTASTGTIPINVTSTTKNTNLNADLLDDFHVQEYQNSGPSFARIPVIHSDGVMEVGKYLDFHDSGNDGVDFTARLYSSSGLLATYNTISAPSINLINGAGVNKYWQCTDASTGAGHWATMSSGQTWKGTWDAVNNLPSLADGTGTIGDMFTVSAGASRNLGSGTIAWPTNGTAQYNGSVWQMLPAPNISGVALTKTDDTNVTLTLGGSASTALVNAASLTLGWTGTLADSRIASAANWNTAYGWGNWASNFGTTAGKITQGNDSRLSDARTPTSHTHGNISNVGAIGTTSGLPVITTTSGVLTVGSFGTTAGTFATGNHSHDYSAIYDAIGAVSSSVTTHELTYNHANYNTAYADRMKWDGGSSGLDAAVAKTSLGLVIGTNILAYRTFGTAANNNTGDFAPSAHVGATGLAHGNATGSVAGFMSSADYTKLAGIASGATNVTNTNQLTNGSGYITSGALSGYATTSWVGTYYLPLAGGTLTGPLNGTSASFSSSVYAYSYCGPSDSTLKKNIRPLVSKDYLRASKIEFRKFNYRADPDSSTRFGPIAQEVEKLVPEVVSTNKESGKLVVNHIDLLYILIAQQKEAIEKLTKRVEELEEKTRPGGHLTPAIIADPDICPKCYKGHLKPTGEVLLSNPPQYPYVCDSCGHAVIRRGILTDFNPVLLNNIVTP